MLNSLLNFFVYYTKMLIHKIWKIFFNLASVRGLVWCKWQCLGSITCRVFVSLGANKQYLFQYATCLSITCSWHLIAEGLPVPCQLNNWSKLYLLLMTMFVCIFVLSKDLECNTVCCKFSLIKIKVDKYDVSTITNWS